MKSSRLFIVAMVVLFAVMFMVEYRTPAHYDWTKTYSHAEENPFGCALFDKIMAQSLPAGYTWTSRSFPQINTDAPDSVRSYLYVDVDFRPPRVSEEAIVDMLDRGCNVMIVTRHANVTGSLRDRAGFIATDYFHSFSASYFNPDSTHHHHIRWEHNRAPVYRDTCRYKLNEDLVTATIDMDQASAGLNIIATYHDLEYEPIDDDLDDDDEEAMEDDENYIEHDVYKPVAGWRQVGKGKLFIVTTPLLFTNYGMLGTQCDGYVMRLMTLLSEGRPVVRIDHTLDTEVAGKSESEFRYLLSEPALRRAFWMLIVVGLLAMVFTARRRQRVIPVMAPPANRTREMVEHIGALYYLRANHVDLVTKKYGYFVETLRRELMVDIDEDPIDLILPALEQVSGKDRDTLGHTLGEIRATVAAGDDVKIDSRTMMEYINFMDHIMQSL